MRRALKHLQRNAIAYLALFVALGGTSYAAATLPAHSVGARQLENGSVGTAQLKNGAVTTAKLNAKSIGGSVRAWAIVNPQGRLVAGGGKVSSEVNAAFPGAYIVSWRASTPRRCATVANVDGALSSPTESVAVPGSPSLELTAGYAVTNPIEGSRTSHAVDVATFSQAGQPTPLAFHIAVIC